MRTVGDIYDAVMNGEEPSFKEMNKYYAYYSCFNGDFTWSDINCYDTEEELNQFIEKVNSSIGMRIIKIIYGGEIEYD